MVQGSQGLLQPAIGATVQVLIFASQLPATLFSDDGITPKSNPTFTDNTGRFDFYVADGRYTLIVTGTGFAPFTANNVEIADLTEADTTDDSPWLTAAFNGELYVGDGIKTWGTGDIGSQINAAYASLPVNGGTINILPPSGGGCYTMSTPVVFSTVGKTVQLNGLTPPGNSTGAVETGLCLNWTPVSGSAITMDWTPGTGGATVGGGMSNITLWNNSCTGTSGCGSSANGLQIGITGSANSGAMGATFSKVKFRGFGSGLILPASSNALSFPLWFNNFTFQNNAIGVNSAQGSEGWHFIVGLFIQNDVAFSQNVTNTQIEFTGVHWDGNVSAGFTGSGCDGGIFTFVANHFENNGGTTTHYVSCGGLGDLLFEGGLAVDDTGAGPNTDFWFNASNIVGNLKIASVGETATNVFVSNMLSMNIINGTPAVLTGVTNGLNSTGTFKNKTVFASSTAPTITSGFGTSPSIASNGTFAITVNVGTGGTATNGVIGMPAAATAWVCTVNNLTAAAAHRADNTRQTARTATSVTIENQTTSTGAAVAWTASDIVLLACAGT